MSNGFRIKEAFCAVEAGDTSSLLERLDGGLDVDVQNEYGWSLLMSAVIANQTEVIAVLLDRGASLDMKDNIGFTAEDHAINCRAFHLPEMMRKRPAAA